MIVALFVVAAAMMAGGAWAVFTGWELIIIERGWTQVLLALTALNLIRRAAGF
jgi:hypothetical protein